MTVGKKHDCYLAISVICHCLPRPALKEQEFRQCCGWYHVACGGRVNDDKRAGKPEGGSDGE
jgi:hypothetical protein